MRAFIKRIKFLLTRKRDRRWVVRKRTPDGVVLPVRYCYEVSHFDAYEWSEKHGGYLLPSTTAEHVAFARNFGVNNSNSWFYTERVI